MDNKQKFSMKFVAQQTGLTTHAIRVWEKRYAAIVPERSPSNRRLFSIEDLKRLEHLAKATQAGHSIGQIAKLTNQELENLCSQGPSPSEATKPTKKNESVTPRAIANLSDTESCIRSCVDAINRMDARNLSDTVDNAENLLGLRELLVSVVDPLVTRLSTNSHRDGASIARNSFSSSVLRSLLSQKFIKRNQGHDRPLLLITTPAGQWEEVGAILVDLYSQSLGWRSLYLGPDLPAEEIVLAAAQNTPSAISVVIAEHNTDYAVAEELIKIKNGLKHTPLLVGGHSSGGYAKLIRDVGGRHFFDLSHLGDELRLLYNQESHSI